MAVTGALLILGIWILITLIAIQFGCIIGKSRKTKLFGAFLGFMLTMGGFLIYLGVKSYYVKIEYDQIQKTVTHLCETESGIFVYITPEEWRKQIREEEWATLNKDIYSENSKFEFNGEIYRTFHTWNRRVWGFSRYILEKKILSVDNIYVDIMNNKVLYQERMFVADSANINLLKGIRFSLDNIDDCGYDSFPRGLRRMDIMYSNYKEKIKNKNFTLTMDDVLKSRLFIAIK